MWDPVDFILRTGDFLPRWGRGEERRGCTAVLDIYDLAREFQAPI